MKGWGAFLLTSLVACSSTPAKKPTNLREFLDQVVAKCDLPPSTLALVSADAVEFKPPADAEYEAVDCALAELKESPFPVKLGFVGNEALRD